MCRGCRFSLCGFSGVVLCGVSGSTWVVEGPNTWEAAGGCMPGRTMTDGLVAIGDCDVVQQKSGKGLAGHFQRVHSGSSGKDLG